MKKRNENTPRYHHMELQAVANPLPVCTTMLPLSVREQMQEALLIEPLAPAGESAARTRALESVIFRARARYPKLFKQEAL